VHQYYVNYVKTPIVSYVVKKITQRIMKKSAFFPGLALCFIFCISGQSQSLSSYLAIDSLLKNKQFFAARDLLKANKKSLSAFHQLKLGAEIDNVFNQLDASNSKIDALFLGFGDQLNDSVLYHLSDIRQSNYARLFNYQKALETANEIIGKYSHLMTENELDDYKNTRIIWQALAGQPKQEVIIKEKVAIRMTRDKARLANLPVSNGVDSLGFIFDTGANISTITESTAARLGMTLMDSVIDVTSITGQKIKSKIAICKDLYIRSIHVKNAVFLVFPDAALYIPQIDYQINGILGFPVIAAMGEVQISRKDEFVVPLLHSIPTRFNLAFDFLTPVIEIGGDSYSFDTGATTTMLYQPYFQKHQKTIEGNYKEKSLSFGGAGGSITKNGYEIHFDVPIGDQVIHLDDIMVFSEQIKESGDHYYGNIGQDLIGKFETMILNFKAMFIQFE